MVQFSPQCLVSCIDLSRIARSECSRWAIRTAGYHCRIARDLEIANGRHGCSPVDANSNCRRPSPSVQGSGRRRTDWLDSRWRSSRFRRRSGLTSAAIELDWGRSEEFVFDIAPGDAIEYECESRVTPMNALAVVLTSWKKPYIILRPLGPEGSADF